MMIGANSGFSVYFHWPFCARICPYCDFNVYRDRGVDSARWTAALVRELEFWGPITPGRKLSSVYFGGGTPSLAPAALVAAVIEACDRLWGFEADPEITLEANPTDAGAEGLRAMRRAGVNRLSLGVQSFDDRALKFLGREHDGATALAAIDCAIGVFPRVNVDLIYALPDQSNEEWAGELRRAIATGVNHLSLYQLTIEDGTAFARAVDRKRWKPANEDRAADLFDLTQELTAAAGLPAYEISNHAARGEESQHNLNYWRQGDYLGVGPGAHGRVTIDGVRRATETERRPQPYLVRVEETGSGNVVNDPLSDEAAMTERLAMGLRTLEGAELTPSQSLLLSERTAALSAAGLLRLEGSRLIATDRGRRILDALLAELLR